MKTVGDSDLDKQLSRHGTIHTTNWLLTCRNFTAYSEIKAIDINLIIISVRAVAGVISMVCVRIGVNVPKSDWLYVFFQLSGVIARLSDTLSEGDSEFSQGRGSLHKNGTSRLGGTKIKLRGGNLGCRRYK